MVIGQGTAMKLKYNFLFLISLSQLIFSCELISNLKNGDSQAESGPTFFVAANDRNANDSNPGSEFAPWKTLEHASNFARPGDTIIIKSGVYPDIISPQNSGSQKLKITFKAHSNSACIKSNDFNILPSCQVKLPGVYLNGKSHIRIEGIEMTTHGLLCQDRWTNTSKGLEIHNHSNSRKRKGVQANNLFENDYAYLREVGRVHVLRPHQV